MQSALKKEFSELLRKIDTTNIDQSTSCNNELDKFFQNVENDYRKIQRSTVTKTEDLKVISGILNQQYGCKSTERHNDDSLKLATDKLIAEAGTNPTFEIQENMIPFYLKKGDWFLRQDRFEETLDAWEEVLRVNPDNEYVHSKLLEIMNAPQAIKNRAGDVHRKYQFKYIGSFGHNLFKRPFAIAAAGNEDVLFVSDPSADKICMFSTQGEYIGSMSSALKRPLGLFKETKGKVWICDFGNSRLLAVDSAGNEVDEIRLRGILGEAFGSIHPVNGCFKEDRFYLSLTDRKLDERRLVSFNKYDRIGSLAYIPLSVLQRPIGIGFIGERLCVGDLKPAALFTYDVDHKQFVPFLRRAIPDVLSRFVESKNGLFISSRRLITKISSHGELIFTVKFNKVLGKQNVYPVGLAVLEEGNNQILLVSDYFQLCIHKFLI